MTIVKYEVVEHDGGWAYKVGDVYSETFTTHQEASTAARIAANNQAVGGKTEHIEFEDSQGVWHQEIAAGDDRPETEVEDK
jgi:hypothetical protein